MGVCRGLGVAGVQTFVVVGGRVLSQKSFLECGVSGLHSVLLLFV